ncbi:MAG: bifunctional folylpolyglutamate synthase/dihydrofolate synthase [Chthoniobacterales bacterium]|nr:bifunctional folylpolyglutamate synthase/dihydrofolate synthase [Chthoniobacterales bacterium]
MNYRDALAWLYGTQTFGFKLGLDNTHRLMAAAGNPHEKLKFLHVAGTNGKGSVCAMLDAVLREAGIRSGLYTSPHLIGFRERILVDGAMIPEGAAAEGLTLLRDAAADWGQQPTFFELATVLAAWWFARSGAEVVAWETGMGGRLDATNVVTPLVSIIVPVGMDHREHLGPTLAAIAGEKAGIIKSGAPVVSAPQEEEVRAVLRARARDCGSPLHFLDVPCEEPLGLFGGHQKWNAALALAALDAAGLVPGAGARRRGLASVQWPGRFQRVRDDLVIDGAHNADAVEVLVRAWRDAFGDTKARLVFGALRDKTPGDLLRLLRAISDDVVLVPVNSARAASFQELRAAAESCGFASLHEGRLDGVLRDAAAGPTLVTGSLFLAGEALALLQGVRKPEPSSQ